jgi:hypothetical protein
VPEVPFHRYVEFNQIWTDYYYSAYPMAASNDIKSAQRVKDELCAFVQRTQDVPPEAFMREYHVLLKGLQGDLGLLAPSPIVSLAAEEVESRRLAKLARASLAAPQAPTTEQAGTPAQLPPTQLQSANDARVSGRVAVGKTGQTRKEARHAK